MSLDHDLGLTEGTREETGYDVLLWIEHAVAAGELVSPVLAVHSANPVARRRMQQAIDSIRRLSS